MDEVKSPESKLKPRIMKTTLMLPGLRKTFYIYNYVDLGKAFDELFSISPPHVGLRLQVRPFDYLKDDHAKNVFASFMKRQEQPNESTGNKVAENNPGGEKDKVQGS